jgi:hypothetical protein
MARLGDQSGARWDRFPVVEEHVGSPLFPGPRLFLYNRLRYLSRTQVLLTKIAQLCNKVRDIKRTIKTNNIVPRLPESTINTNRNKDRIDDPGIDDPCEKGCSNSSHNNPIPHESDLSYSIDKPQASEERPIHQKNRRHLIYLNLLIPLILTLFCRVPSHLFPENY